MDNEDNDPPADCYTGSDSEGTPIPPALRRARARNHQRGYFDVGVASTATAVKRTPPSTPLAPRSESAARCNSFPPSNGSVPSGPVNVGPITVPEPKEQSYLSPTWHLAHLSIGMGLEIGGSEESTPSISSNGDSSQSSSSTSSPMHSPVERPAQLYADDVPEASSYNVFLDRYGFRLLIPILVLVN